MLKPREADIPALFLVLVVLPLVTYILLGKWNEAAKKKSKISKLAQLVAEEAQTVEEIAVPSAIPAVLSSKIGYHECARCFRPATNRCSRCKSVRYCSGKCQIIHWRRGHKLECQLLGNRNSNMSTSPAFFMESAHNRVLDENLNSLFLGFELKDSLSDSVPPEVSVNHPIMTATATNLVQVPVVEGKHADRWASRNFNRESLKSEEVASLTPSPTSYCSQSKEAPARMKLAKDTPLESSDETPVKPNFCSPSASACGQTVQSALLPPYTLTCQNQLVSESSSASGIPKPVHPEKDGIDGRKAEMDFMSYNVSTSKRSMKKASREQLSSVAEKKVYVKDEPKIPQELTSTALPVQSSNGNTRISGVKMGDLKKQPDLPSWDVAGATSDSFWKDKVLFPFEELVEFFHCDVWNLSPRGLLNCGNSCYANAVLQCLTCTKPLVVYLLRRSHSRTCRVRDWCLMCELEQHVSMLREGGGPLSPSRILSHMQNVGCHMGSGDQEDAHEFLRLLVASMQSIYLEAFGGEKEVDSRLQETTLIQQIFGGCLRSKVACLRCHHESERYENIMDLTLEISGWVESLEDALAQFTTPEELDGENMYRCGRCAAYVKARKQLRIHEAPNILTIVLKRFQAGKYGKINKCITFPDMLDMLPFMTGTGDCPPLYTLYGVVVHLDTLNASFSGHYVSYVKDLQGTWSRIDDTKVERASVSQVMSEGAYILFYSRSYPRPPRIHTGQVAPLHAPDSAKQCTPGTHKSSRNKQYKQNSSSFVPDHSLPFYDANVGDGPSYKPSIGLDSGNNNQSVRMTSRDILPTRQTYTESVVMDSPDAPSSDWSLFTSSDESSFTTESTRDSFSTVDYSDVLNFDPISSIFGTYRVPDHPNNNISFSKFSPSRPQKRFFLERNGFVLDSSMLTQQVGSVHKGRNLQQVTNSSSESLASSNNCGMSIRFGNNPKNSFVQTSGFL